MDGQKPIHIFPNLVCNEAVSTFVEQNYVKLCYWTKGYVIFSTKKDQNIFMVPNWFIDKLQPFLVEPFFDQVPNKGSALVKLLI